MTSTSGVMPLTPGLRAEPPDRSPSMGHSLLSPSPSRSAGSLGDGADLFAAGLAGHERVERDSLRAIVGGDDRVLRAIYFGNWQRDFSQFIPEWIGEPWCPRRLGRVMFRVCSVLARHEFGRTLDAVSFGSYRWEEHIDNPREFGRALDPTTYDVKARRSPVDEPNATLALYREDADGLQRYLQSSRDYAVGKIGVALARGRTPAGYENLGAAFHTIEDLYAHSNFVELCMIALGRPVNPMTGTIRDTGEAIRDRHGRYRLTTGVFTRRDTFSSLSKILLTHVEGVPSSPAEHSITEALVEEFLGSTAASLYRRLAPAPGSHPSAFGQMVTDHVLAPLRQAVAAYLHPLAERFAQTTGRTAYQGFVFDRPIALIETSHSLVAKDDIHLPYHPVARRLAATAVARLWQEIDSAWRSGTTDVHRSALPRLVREFINHPLSGERWWEPAVRAASATAPPSGPGRPPTGVRRPLLRPGSAGPAVRALQQRLNDWLARAPGRTPLALDGRYGPATQSAVVAYQRASSLPPDGVAGPGTWAALDRMR